MKNKRNKSGSALRHLAIIALATVTGLAACTSVKKSPWTIRDSGVEESLNGVTYGGPSGREIFVAVGDCSQVIDTCIGNGTILTSPDGITWTERDSGVEEALNAVTYGGASGSELFVAIGRSGTILSSPDGTTWTVRNSEISQTLRAVAYGGASGRELFVAVGGCINDAGGNCTNSNGGSLIIDIYGSMGSILTSPDGITWTVRDSESTERLNGVTYGNGRFVAVGMCPVNSEGNCSGDAEIITSPDGITWTERSSSLRSSLFDTNTATTTLRSTFVAVSSCLLVSINRVCPHRNPILTSSNGNTWLTRENPSGLPLSSVTNTSNGLLAVGLCSTDGRRCSVNSAIVTSNDGVAWTAEESGVKAFLYDAVYANNVSVIVGGRSCSYPGTFGNCTSGNSTILTK